MGDEECLQNRGDVRVPAVPLQWHYLKWDSVQVDTSREQKTARNKKEKDR